MARVFLWRYDNVNCDDIPNGRREAGIAAYNKFRRVQRRPYYGGNNSEADRAKILGYAREAFKAAGWSDALSGRYDRELEFGDHRRGGI